MKYYRRYVGDYLRDTSRLSMLEHGAYNLMLDYYYADEQPLPLDRDELYIMVRAMTPADRKAVDKVVATYFTQRADGWHHKRVDDELEKSKGAIEKQRVSGIEAAGKRWANPSTSDGSEDGSTHGSTHSATHHAPIQEGHGSAIQPPRETHPPTTNHQEKPFRAVPARSPASATPPPGFAAFWAAWPPSQRKVAKADCLKRWRKHNLESIADRIVAHVKDIRGCEQWRDGFEPSPSTYLNQRRWEDDPADQRKGMDQFAGVL